MPRKEIVMRKVFLLAVACVVLSTILWGCGSGGGSGTTLNTDPKFNTAATSKALRIYSGTFSSYSSSFPSVVYSNKMSMYKDSTGKVTGHMYKVTSSGTVEVDPISGTIDSSGTLKAQTSKGREIDGTIDASGNFTNPATCTWVDDVANKTVTSSGTFSVSLQSPATARFVDNNNGTITDTLTSLTWLKDTDCFGKIMWDVAQTKVKALASGQCGLTDSSVAGRWRLPTVSELLFFSDGGYTYNSLLNYTTTYYWSESFTAGLTSWEINSSTSVADVVSIDTTNHVWAVHN